MVYMEKIHADHQLVFSVLKKREKDTHKGTYGRALNIAGSRSYYGAAILSTSAAIRSGCGYIYCASSKEINQLVVSHVPEAVFIHLGEDPRMDIAQVYPQMNAISYGCGVGNEEDTQVLEYLLQGEKPLVIDADGLNRLSRQMDLLKEKKCEVILTPHLGEFKRLSNIDLTGCSLYEKAEVAQRFAQTYQSVLLLKGSTTLVAGYLSDEIYVIDNGSPGMAKAGSGDALTGILVSLMAQGVDPLKAAVCGAWLHAEAGSTAAKKYSETAMTASDLIECLKDVFQKYDR